VADEDRRGPVEDVEPASQQPIAGPTAGNAPDLRSEPAVAGVDGGEDSRRRQERPPMWDMDLDLLRAALAQAEQQLATSTYVLERYGTVRQRWQDIADTLNQELGRLADTRPYVSIAETNVAIERATAERIDELRGALGQSRIGRPALRGAAREELAEELTGLINANPALRFDPVLREDRWSTIIERAQRTEQQQTAELRAQLKEATATAADNAAIMNDAASGIDAQTDRRDVLSVELDAQAITPAAGDGDTHEAGMVATPDGKVTSILAEPISAEPTEASVTATAEPAAVPHEQLQLRVDSPVITEGLGA
jgi:hypothetical protein